MLDGKVTMQMKAGVTQNEMGKALKWRWEESNENKMGHICLSV